MVRLPVHPRAASLAVFLALAIGCARGDEILIGNRTVHSVRIVNYDRGTLEFRTSEGNYERADITRVEFLVVDSVNGSADFNAAEEYLLKDRPAQAVDRYERALRSSRGMWADLIRVRLLVASDRAGMTEKAVRAALDVIASDPVTGARLLPESTPPSRSRTADRTMKRIDEAIAEMGVSSRVLVEMLRYRLLRSLKEAEADRLAPAIAKQQLPVHLLTARTESIRREAVESLLRAGKNVDVLDAVESALPELPLEYTPAWLLLKAEAQLATATDEAGYFEAALTAMRIAIYYKHNEASGRALLLAAKAHEKTGRHGDAVRLLRECLARDAVADAEKSLARVELKRLTAVGAS